MDPYCLSDQILPPPVALKDPPGPPAIVRPVCVQPGLSSDRTPLTSILLSSLIIRFINSSQTSSLTISPLDTFYNT